MTNAWSSMPPWSALYEQWAVEMSMLGQPPQKLTATIDVTCPDAYQLKRAAMIEGLWVSRNLIRRRPSLEASDLFAEAAMSRNTMPNLREVSLALSRTAGNTELVAAVLIAATASGYADHGDSLQMAGSLARARLEAAGLPVPRQTQRPTFLAEDRFDLGGMDVDALPRALAIEHAGLVTGVIAARVRLLLETDDGQRVPAEEERRVGLIEEVGIATARSLIPAVSPVAKRPDNPNHHRVALSSLPLDEQHTIVDAIAEGLASQGVSLDPITDLGFERRASSLFGPLLQVAVDPHNNDGWRLRICRPPLMTIVPDDPDGLNITVSEEGTIDRNELAALAGLVRRTVDLSVRIDTEGMKIEEWERVDPRDLRIDPLTRRLLAIRGVNLDEGVQWRIGDEGKEAPEPVSFFSVQRFGLRATAGRVHILRVWLPCPRDGGILVEDDGRTQRVITPRHVPRTKLDRPLGTVLGQPDLFDIEDVMIDSIVTDAEGRSVLYLRSRPTSLPFPDEYQDAR